jgi:N-formylglutamate amidohydrolase
MRVMGDDPAEKDSQESVGGHIPGAPGWPAFRAIDREPSILPVMIAVPHAGRAYTRALLSNMRHPESAALKLEDRYVDKLARIVAHETGAGLLLAEAPRAMIDLNRAPDDVDWEMIAGARRADRAPEPASRRARSGLGLIPRRLPGFGELWRRRHEAQELAARISEVHAPYHARLEGMLSALRERWGAALLIDLHSMPPLTARGGHRAAEFVIGDRFGTTCHGSLVGAAFAQLAQAQRLAAHNRPYAGGYVLERHARPGNGIHAMQIEIDRSIYLDERMAEPGPGFEEVAGVIVGLVRRLAGVVAELASENGDQVWPLAAE